MKSLAKALLPRWQIFWHQIGIKRSGRGGWGASVFLIWVPCGPRHLKRRHYGECGQSQERGANTGYFAVLPEQGGIEGGENAIRPLLSSRPMNQIMYYSLPEAFSCCCLGWRCEAPLCLSLSRRVYLRKAELNFPSNGIWIQAPWHRSSFLGLFFFSLISSFITCRIMRTEKRLFKGTWGERKVLQELLHHILHTLKSRRYVN